jgi:dipeptidyl aminopeptidase/acylaminoacyl peptidase
VDPAQIAIVGSSYGGYLAAIASGMRKVRWLALRAPALYRDENWNMPKGELDRRDLNVYRRTVIQPQENRALCACAEFKGDALVIESEVDQTVPHEAVQNYVNALKNVRSVTYRVLSDADHALSTDDMRQSYGLQLVGWMTEMLLGAKAASGKVRPAPRSPA